MVDNCQELILAEHMDQESTKQNKLPQHNVIILPWKHIESDSKMEEATDPSKEGFMEEF